MTTISGISSFSGLGGSCDYIVATQSKKPQINIWQWGKPHSIMQCHIQEITTAISSDIKGYFLCGGTKGGRIFIWEISSGVLIHSWQAHFKSITTITFTSCGNFLISTSEDGMVRVWDLLGILNNTNHFELQSRSDGQLKSITPYRLQFLSLFLFASLLASFFPCLFVCLLAFV